MTSSLVEEPGGGGQKTTDDDLMTEEHICSQFMRARGAGVDKMTSWQGGLVWTTLDSDDAFYEQPSRIMEKN